VPQCEIKFKLCSDAPQNRGPKIVQWNCFFWGVNVAQSSETMVNFFLSLNPLFLSIFSSNTPLLH